MEGKISEMNGIIEVDYTTQKIGDCWVQIKAKPATQYSQYFLGDRQLLSPVNDPINGTVIVEHITKLIDEAREIVCLSTFLIQEGAVTKALIDASQRGVRVYILTAMEEDLKKATDDLTPEELAKIDGHKKLLNEMAGKILIRTAPHFHAKFLLVDPHSVKKGVIMTCNATVGAMTGENIEIAATLNGEEVESLFAQFSHGFWNMSSRQLTAPGRLDVVGEAPPVKYGEIRHPATLKGVNTLKDTLIQMIDTATESVIASAWSFDEEWAEILIKAQKRGVKVTVYVRQNMRNTGCLLRLAGAGATVKSISRIHAKTLLADGKRGLIMTANYTSKGMDEGFEAAIMIDDKNADFFNKTICAWDSLCNWELRTNATLGDIMGEALVYRSGNKDLEKVAVVERDARELKPVTTNSVEDMVNYKPEVKTDNNGQVRYKKVIFSYKVLPPTLPSDAVQAEGIDTGLEVYKKKGQHYIVIDRWEQIQNAIENNKFNARIVARP